MNGKYFILFLSILFLFSCSDEGVNPVYGCIDENALNYDPLATEDDESCYFTLNYDLDLHDGANLVSFYALPEDSSISSFFNSIENNIEGVIAEGNAASITENGWIGSLLAIEPTNGYWIIMENSDILTIDGYPIGTDIEYSLHQGANLISFPDEDSYSIYDVIPDELQGIIYAVLSVGTAAVYDNGEWIGSLESLSGGEGYWFKTLYDVPLVFNIDNSLSRKSVNEGLASELSGFNYNQSSQQAFYFINNVEGIENGDWILAYNDNVLVGYRQWLGNPIDVPVMGYDGYDYSLGYSDINDLPSFKLYKSNSGDIVNLYGEFKEWVTNDISFVDNLYQNQFIMPEDVNISSVYPNPFNPITKLEFSIPEKMNIEINILDIQGRKIKNIINSQYDSGYHSINIDGSDLSSGIYFIQLLGESSVDFSKIILLK